MVRLRGLPSALFAGALGVIAVALGCGEDLEVNSNGRPDGGGLLAADGATPGDGGGGGVDDASFDGAPNLIDASNCGTKPDPIVFVTSGVYRVDRGTPQTDGTVLDKLCTDVAHDAGINRPFIAYVRLGSTPPAGRLPVDQKGYLLPTGVVAFPPGQKPPGNPNNAIKVTERCKELDATDDAFVWTGEGIETATCGTWTNASGQKGNIGNALLKDVGWQAGDAVDCTGLHHFYCFEQR